MWSWGNRLPFPVLIVAQLAAPSLLGMYAWLESGSFAFSLLILALATSISLAVTGMDPRYEKWHPKSKPGLAVKAYADLCTSIHRRDGRAHKFIRRLFRWGLVATLLAAALAAATEWRT